MARRLLALAVSATALQAPHAKAPTAPLQATATAPAKTGPTWDDHVAIPEAPDTMVKGVEGNDSMRCDLGVPRCCGAFTPSMRLVSMR